MGDGSFWYKVYSKSGSDGTVGRIRERVSEDVANDCGRVK